MFPIATTGPIQVIETVIAIVYPLLAILVTIDVLLKKNDVRAALGWIGGAWLSPIFGALLYYMFGINRVTRRALKLRRFEDSQSRRKPDGATPIASPNIALLAEVGRRVTRYYDQVEYC